VEVLQVIRADFPVTVQDLGRPGYQKYGVPPSGAMDAFAHRIANLLVGNPQDSATLEVTLVGPELLVLQSWVVAVAGADWEIYVDGISMPTWTTLFVRRDQVIAFRRRRQGARCYLAVQGGLDVPPVLGSRSTYLPGGFGGFYGRALQPGDILRANPTRIDPSEAGRQFPETLRPYAEEAIRVLPGPLADLFAKEAWHRLTSEAFEVTQQADRIGYRLQGPELNHRGPTDIISGGLATGCIQVPAGRQPIVLMVDRQTTGGYPVIASVISADLHRVAQKLPGDKLTFRLVTLEEAIRAKRQMEANIRAFAEGLKPGR
jgi:antagonist of KipI